MRLFPLSIVLAWFCVGACRAALAPPVFTPGGGLVHSPALIAITNPNASGVIFYTMDGTDPRDVFGRVMPLACIYRAPLSVNRSITIRARVKTDLEWSELAAGAYTADQDFSKLLFTEVMYHPQDRTDVTEYVELKNVGTTTLDLTGLHFAAFAHGFVSAGFDFAPQTRIGPGEFVLLVSHETSFRATYPPVPIHGQYVGDLWNSFERLAVRSSMDAEAAWMQYHSSAPWQVVPDNHGYFANDGVGFSLARADYDPDADPGSPATWKASAGRLGSPGLDNPVSTVPPIYINELLTRSATGARDAVEFFNPNPFDVDLHGWWLSDERNDPRRYQIPAGTIVPAGGYLVMNDSQFGAGANGIAFSAEGERCYLFSADLNGELTGFSHGLQFGASAPDMTFGRYVSSDRTEHFPPQSSRTFGAANAPPLISPVTISEIVYRPQMGAPAYVELRNATDAAVELWDPLNPQTTWMLEWTTGRNEPMGTATLVPPGTALPAQGHLIFTAEAPSAFRARYNVPPEVPIILIPNPQFDHGGLLRLLRPAGTANGNARYLEVEWVEVSDRAPWPVAAAGGVALERINMTGLAGDPANWRVSPTLRSPGITNGGNVPPAVWAGEDRVEFVGRTTSLVAAVADDGMAGVSLVSGWSQLSGPAAVQFVDASHPRTTATFPAAGEYVLQLQASDGTFTSNDTVSIQVMLRPFDAWQASAFTVAELADPAISGPLADPDHDGRPNLHEYFYTSHPKQSNQENGPRAEIVNGRLQVRWKERAGAFDVVAKPERADRLEGPWFGTPELFAWTRVDQGAFSEVTVSERLPVEGRGAGFIRLQISLR